MSEHPSSPPVAMNNLFVLAPDEFGRVVQVRLAESLDDVQIYPFETAGVLAEVGEAFDCIVVAAEHLDLSACRMMDEIAWRKSKYLLTVSITGPFLRVGPMVVPGESACWNCYAAREQQHVRTGAPNGKPPEQNSRLSRRHLEPVAQIAASRVSYVTSTPADIYKNAGCIWDMDLASERIHLSRVIGSHDCPLCGLHRPIQSLSTAALLAECGDLWSPTEAAGAVTGDSGSASNLERHDSK